MGWRIYATAGLKRSEAAPETHATLYLTPEGRVCLRAKAGEELLLDSFSATVDDALLDAALRPELPQPLYDALMDAVARRLEREQP